mgnify:CR=1 FL=1
MSEFIHDIPFVRFKQLKASELKELKSFAVTSDGGYLMTVIIPRTDFIQVQAEYLAQLSNSVGGKDVIKEEVKHDGL